MPKITPLSDINIIAQAAPVINANYDKIEQAFDNTLSRDGSSPNQMEADIDLNSNDLLNVGHIETTSLEVQGQDVSGLLTAAASAIAAAVMAEASKDQAEVAATNAEASAATIASQLLFLPDWKGSWLTSVVYTYGDLVEESGNTYICILPHTSGVFSTDLGSLKWALFAQRGAAGVGTGDMFSSNNLSELVNKTTSRSNLGVPARAVDSVISANWTFEDNPTASLRFGTDQDTKIWYDNTNAILAFETLNTPTAHLKLRFPVIELTKVGGSEVMAKFSADGASELFHDGTKRIETISTGAKITGALQADTVSGTWLATLAEMQAGSNTTKITTPKLVADAIDERFTASYGSNGYISFKINQGTPRLYLQWGRYSVAAPAGAGQRVTYPVAFSNFVLSAWVSVDNAAAQMIGIVGSDRFGYTVQKGSGDSGARTGWFFAIGY